MRFHRDGIDHLLPAVQDDTGQETPIDMRIQWNERDFFARVYANPVPTKADRHALIKDLLLQVPVDVGWRPSAIRTALAGYGIHVDFRLLTRDLKEIGAVRIERGRYTYVATPQEIERARVIARSIEGSTVK